MAAFQSVGGAGCGTSRSIRLTSASRRDRTPPSPSAAGVVAEAPFAVEARTGFAAGSRTGFAAGSRTGFAAGSRAGFAAGRAAFAERRTDCAAGAPAAAAALRAVFRIDLHVVVGEVAGPHRRRGGAAPQQHTDQQL